MILATPFFEKETIEVFFGAVFNEKQVAKQPNNNFSIGKCPQNEFKGLYPFFSTHLNEVKGLFAIGKK